MPAKRTAGRGARGHTHAESYYYAGGEKVGVSKRGDLVAVVFNSRARDENFETFASSRAETLEASSEFPEMQQSNVRIFKLANGRTAAAVRSLVADIRGEG